MLRYAEKPASDQMLRVDTHCHVDLYDNPSALAKKAERENVVIIAVTNLPSAFERIFPHAQMHRNLRLALGLHPQLADKHSGERDLFRMNLSKTSYVGEIGLDYSRDAKNSAREQLSSFRFVMETIGTQPKFLSIHSRGAEEAVLDVLDEFGKRGAVLHWFSGSAPSLGRGLRQGHFFSVNPAMVRSPRGRKLIELMPRDRVLLETDGPFVKIGTKIVQQSDLPVVESFLSSLWGTEESDVARQLTNNFTSVLSQLGRIEQTV